MSAFSPHHHSSCSYASVFFPYSTSGTNFPLRYISMADSHPHTHIHRVLMMVAKVRAYTFVRLHEPRYSRNKLRFHCGSKLCFCFLVIFTFRPCISLVCWCTVLLRLVHNLTHALWFRWHERPSIQKYFLLNLLICPVIFSGKIFKLP